MKLKIDEVRKSKVSTIFITEKQNVIRSSYLDD